MFGLNRVYVRHADDVFTGAVLSGWNEECQEVGGAGLPSSRAL